MARNSSGTYSLPAGNPVVAGTTIEATWANDTMSDIAEALTNSLARDGKGGMLAPLRFADGSAASPSAAFSNETGSGLYRVSAGVIAWSILGTQRLRLNATGATVTGTLTTSGAATFGGAVDVTGNITVSGTVDGRDIAADGALLDTALQPGDNVSDLTNDSGYLTSVSFGDLTSTPTTLAGYGITDAATSTQGALADTAIQPGDDVATLGSGAATSGQILEADGSGNLSFVDPVAIPSGTDEQTLRYNGTSLEATSVLTNDGVNIVGIEATIPTLQLQDDDSTVTVGQALGRVDFRTSDTVPLAARIEAQAGTTSGNGELAFLVNDGATEVLRLNRLGRVGINTDTPNVTLEVVDDNAELRLSDTGSGLAEFTFRVDAGRMDLREGNVAMLSFLDYKVGWNETSPADFIHMTEDGTNDPAIRFENSNQIRIVQPSASTLDFIKDPDGTPESMLRLSTVTGPQIYAALNEEVSAEGSITGATTLNMQDGSVFTANMTGNVTFTFSSLQDGMSFTLVLTTGGNTVTWPGSVIWKDGAAPTLDGSNKNVLTFFQAGADIIGAYAGAFS